MTTHLERWNREGRLAHRSPPIPANISLYQRHGFKALGRIEWAVAADDPDVETSAVGDCFEDWEA